MVHYGSSMTSAKWESNTQSYMTELVYGNISVAQMASMVSTMTAECDVMLTDETLRAVLTSQVFDVAIVDHIFTCGFLLARQLSLPVVVLECALHQSGLTDSVDPHPLAYVPVDLTGFTHRMSFSERAQNAIRYWLHVIMFPQLMLRPFDAIKEKHKMAPGVDISLMKREALLWVTNQCWALNYPRPLLPAVIAAGGLLTRPAKPLSQDFASLFAAAGDAGVIIVTFGSYLNLKGIPALESAVLQGLAHLPQTVIYRANHSVPDAPPNVVVRNHLPQNDLFGHPGTRAVVLHGGLNGVYESVYHAMPTLVIPFGFDAIDNAVRMRDKGMARIINPYDVTPERVRAAMLDLLSNNSYSQRAQKVSALFTDRTEHPLETAAFWVEHVMRHKTEITSHDYLRSAGNELRLWELYLTDVTAACLFLLLVLLVAIYRLTKCAWKSFIGCVKYKVE